KPDNVLVSDDGEGLGLRARVVDFGLASTLAEDPELVDAPATASASRVDNSESALTITGARLGTPAYMAPEQIAGRPADARCDQFSFALALHEALTGQRAFAGERVEELHAAVLAGRRRSPARRIPRGLRLVIDRALELDPQRRFPSMLVLLSEIERARAARRRGGVALAGVSVALTAGALGSAVARPVPCAGGQAAIATTWDAPQRAAVESAFLATDKPYAAKAWAEAARRLDDYARAWATMHDDACAATRVRGEQSSEALDLRMVCLERRRDELAALVEEFSRDALDPSVVSRAVEASDSLTPIDGCADLEALASPESLPEDPRIRTQVATLRRQIARGKAARDAGRYREALAIAEQVDAAAEQLAYRPLRAETALLVGTLRGLLGEADTAELELERGFTLALASGHTEVAMWTAIHAVHVVGFVGHHGFEGRRWARLAEPLVTRLDSPPRAEASLVANLGNIAVLQGELDEAETRFQDAIERATADVGARDVMIARSSANLGAVYRRRGDYERALAAYRRAESIFDENLGPRHPAMATLANNMGALYQAMGSLADAERSYQTVLELAGSSIAATSPTLGHAHNNFGELLLERGEPAAAAEHFTAAIEIWEQSLAPAHPLVAHPLMGLGRARLALGDAPGAVSALRRALELREGAGLGPGGRGACFVARVPPRAQTLEPQDMSNRNAEPVREAS
ncbi:MAG: tetratricopeptide repeat protein, partial [Myxococcales bacterium]|nr:tetratricopeptide repeat protein [Myxococcales bacterium]